MTFAPTSKSISKSGFASLLFRKLKTLLLNPRSLMRYVKAKQWALLQAKLNSQWSQQDYVLSNIELCDKAFYEANKSVTEIEHQVGRYLNMKNITDEIVATGLEGDVVEFGTWQGLGLILLSRCFSGDRTRRKLIGIDSFEGLPESSTVWLKGSFSNTSIEAVERNTESKIGPNDLLSVELIKGWFSDKAVEEKLSSLCREIALVHFDADLGSSTTQALALIQPYLIGRTKPVYFLFDDWGCHPDEVPDAFLNWLSSASTSFHLQAHKLCSTRFTRYYKITFDH